MLKHVGLMLATPQNTTYFCIHIYVYESLVLGSSLIGAPSTKRHFFVYTRRGCSGHIKSPTEKAQALNKCCGRAHR
uniref:Uncharacterized protein n=1 Tax=Ixodes ricinus TaxID=34613 RepID=A0A6B0U3Y7_IXORI